MTQLRGKPVTDAMAERLRAQADALRARGVIPTLALVRVGEKPDDLSYQRGAVKRCESLGVDARVFAYPADIRQDAFLAALDTVAADPDVHGILLLRPLPRQLDEAQVLRHMPPEKDMDCLLTLNLGRVFCDDPTAAAPCTAQAVMELLHHYQIPLEGKRVTVVGRSLVVGKPLAMLLLRENATVTLCGDVDMAAAEPVVAQLTPVPGGVGGVTTSVLAQNVLRAAARAANG